MWDKINYIYKMTWMIKLTRVDFGVSGISMLMKSRKIRTQK